MEIFLPGDYAAFLPLLLGICFLVFTGYVLLHVENKPLSRAMSWAIGIGITFLAHYFTMQQPAGYRMLVIILIMFISMKMIVANEYAMRAQPLSFRQWLAFALGWFGMNPQVFTRRDINKRTSQGWQLIWFGISRIAIGTLLCIVAWFVARQEFHSDWFQAILIIILLLPGLSLILHFGILNVNSGIWNLFGYGAYSLFRSPLSSLSLSEFWGRRWNYAFSEMTSIAVYRPLKKIISNRMAMIAAFAFSGLLHELAISVPVNKGYGLPSLYFVIQSLAMVVESKIHLKSKALKHAWVMFWLIAPLPLLFQYYFLNGIIWPVVDFHMPDMD